VATALCSLLAPPPARESFRSSLAEGCVTRQRLRSPTPTTETPLEQIAKVFNRHPRVFDYSAQGQRVHRVVSRYGNEMRTVAHDNVFTLTHDLKSWINISTEI
jgi:hypothetical protein